MNKLPIIIGVLAIIVVGAILGIFLIYHPSTSPTTSHSTTPTPTSSSTTSHVTSEVSLTVSDINATGVAEYQGINEQAYIVNVSVTNNLPSAITVNQNEFQLKTSSLLCSPKGFSTYSSRFSYKLLPGNKINITIPFIIPKGSVPECIVFSNSTLLVHVSTPFPTPYKAISVIKLHELSNDTELFASTTSHSTLFLSGKEITTITVYSNHSSIPVEVFSAVTNQSHFKVYLKPTYLNPGGTETATLEIIPTSNTLSYYCNLYVTLLDRTNVSVELTGCLINAAPLTKLCNVEGYKYFLANVSVSYFSGNSFDLKPFDFYILTSDGTFRNCYSCNRVLPSYIYDLSEYMLNATTITKGVSVHGMLVFKVPESAVPTKIVYKDFSGQTLFFVPVSQPVKNLIYIAHVYINFQTKIPYYSPGICINTFKFSGEECTFTYSFHNGCSIPLNISSIVGVSPSYFRIISSNASNLIIPSCATGYFRITFQYPNESYIGDLNITIRLSVAHLLSFTVLNYTLDHASACRQSNNNMKYVVYKIQMKYFGPGKMGLCANDFILVTTEGNYTLNRDCDLIPYNCFLSEQSLTSGEVICGYVSFLIPQSATPMKLLYVDYCCMGNANITLVPYLASYIQYICLVGPCGIGVTNHYLGSYYYGCSVINITFSLYCGGNILEVTGVGSSQYFTVIAHGPFEATTYIHSWIELKLHNVSVDTNIYIIIKRISNSGSPAHASHENSTSIAELLNIGILDRRAVPI
ncbi:DUF4352 domain-containing protein [Acidianus sp. HS-5]|uniref:DUF4352 domain-containing protein n=1 Tax=Acidianus sp. HS-5 TaxID=2886040 RepID=UPI001F2CC03F|nr:DUF4352 domain-containing protein [Acidianus sp. HS-5]BDC17479.1 hypothetical protein HS5_03690 [Acidianus sp. HS-5]